MHIITKKVTLKPAPFVGTRITIEVAETDEDKGFGIRVAKTAEGSSTPTVDWGDGTVETLTANTLHEYACAGTYEVVLSDDIAEIAISSSSEVSRFRTAGAPKVIEFSSNAHKIQRIISHCFNACVNIVSVRFDCPNLTALASSVFSGCEKLSGRLDFPALLTIAGKADSLPFANCGSLAEVHFSKANEDSLLECTVFNGWEQTHLGEANAVIKFDL